MTATELSSPENQTSRLYAMAYRAFSYLGLMTVFGSLLHGFRYSPDAPAANYGFNFLLYAAFTIPHLIMTRPWYKRAVWGNAAGSSRERRCYIFVTIVTWLAVFALHKPMPGGAVMLSADAMGLSQFVGQIGLLFASFLFFEGATLQSIDRLLGAPGSEVSHSHGPETPLHTEGSYSQVRHPMYRAALVGGLCSLLIHPHMAQLFWVGLVGVTFIGFIPIEERQMIAARGEDYRRYMQETPYRLLRGIW